MSLREPQAGVRHRRRHRADVGEPFLKLTDALPLDPMRPMAVRTLIDAVYWASRDHLPGGTHHRHRQPDEGL